MNKWTKGPWEKADCYYTMVQIESECGEPICEMEADGFIDECGDWCVEMNEEQKANANLIAAAPELYEALSSSLALIKSNAIENPDCKFSQRLYVHAVDALAKARGE